nr:hypothetical protein [uncultured Flavobacterium sp.]
MADEKQEAGRFNWDALENDDQFGTNQQTETKVIEVTDDKEDGNEMTEKTEEKKETTATEEKKEEKAEIQGEKKEDLKEEKKEEKSETKEENPEVKEEVAELNLEHLKDYKAEAEDGTWKAVGQMFDVEFENDSPEEFKAAIEKKYQAKIDEAKNFGEEALFAKYKPETVAAIKLTELGYDGFNPTGIIDSQLKMNDVDLVRLACESREGWDEERVNLEMEDLTKVENSNKLKHEALKIREWLTANKNEINTKRDALINEYTQSRERVAIEQRNNEIAQLKSALDGVQDFMGVKINPQAKAEILQRSARGEYSDKLKDPKFIAKAIYFDSFGDNILETAKKSSYAKGKEEYAKQMLNIPPKQAEVAKKVTVEKQINQEKGFNLLKEDFG